MTRLFKRGAPAHREATACRLGFSREITEEYVEGMLERMHEPPQAEPLPTAEPEEIIEESD